MTPNEFRKAWNPDSPYGWVGFDMDLLKETEVSKTTIDWLTGGFPEAAPPFLNFGLDIYGGINAII